MFCDATYLHVRRDSVSKEALDIIIGINKNGNKEVLYNSLFPEKSANNYKKMLIDLKSRGLENVSIFLSDALGPQIASQAFLKRNNYRNVSKSIAPKMLDSLMRNIENIVREKLNQRKNNLFTFMNYPRQIRKNLYTNNICENFNKNLKKGIKPKIQFPNEDSLDKNVYSYVSEYNTKFTSRIHIRFGQVRYKLEKMMDEFIASSTTN